MSSENEKKKRAFRNTKAWKTFRHEIISKQKVDFITKKKLLSGCQVHHELLDPTKYNELNPDNFVALNSQTHKMVHWIWTYYQKDKGVIDRLKEVLDKMIELNKEK